jgi:peroxiredoxin
MSVPLLAARLVLAGVLTVAAAAKLLDHAGARRAMHEFGVPARLTRPAATVLPLAELAAAAALVGRGSARWGAIGALALLALFSLAIARALSQGRQPDCHCFGRLHAAPAGRAALVRNLVLVGIAGFILAAGWRDPGASATAWLAPLSPGALAAITVGVAVVALQAWFSWQLLRQQGRLLLRIEQLEVDRATPPAPGLAPGSIAPDFTLATADGETRSLTLLRDGDRPLLLLFTDPGCGPCQALLPEIVHWQVEHSRELRLVALSRPNGDASLESIEQSGARDVLVDREGAVREVYGVHGVPAAVLVGRDGRVEAPAALGAEAIRTLVNTALRTPAWLDGPEELSYGEQEARPPKLDTLLAGAGARPLRASDVRQQGNGR